MKINKDIMIFVFRFMDKILASRLSIASCKFAIFKSYMYTYILK